MAIAPLKVKWSGNGLNTVALTAQNATKITVDWGDASTLRSATDADDDDQGEIDGDIDVVRTYLQEGDYTVVVRATEGGSGKQILKAFIHSENTTDQTLSGTGYNDIVLGGIGNDTINGGKGDDYLVGDAGDDRLVGGAGDDVALGGLGNDYIKDSSGENLLGGQEGNDTIIGGADRDFIYGDDDDDVLDGGAGSDYVNGGSGRDKLNGGIGDDTIVGGSGTDLMTGGAGPDTFEFNFGSESGVGGARDVIADFVQGGVEGDVIDLFDIGDTTWIGVAAFTGAGGASAGEVRYFSTNGAKPLTIVQVDLDGNGASDMDIALRGTFALTESDFILQ